MAKMHLYQYVFPYGDRGSLKKKSQKAKVIVMSSCTLTKILKKRHKKETANGRYAWSAHLIR